MAWIDHRTNGVFVRWRVQGKKHSARFADDIEALQFKIHVERRLAAGERPLVPVGMAEYGEHAITAANHLEDSTRGSYLEWWGIYHRTYFGDLSVAALTNREAEGFITHLRGKGLSRSYVGSLGHLLLLVMRAAAQDGLIPRDHPFLSWKAPRKDTVAEGGPVQPLEPETIEALADAVATLEPRGRHYPDPARYRLAVLMGGYCGLRAGEVSALTNAAIDREMGELRVVASVKTVTKPVRRFYVGEPKTRAGRRSIPVDEWMVEEIERHIEDYGLSDDGRLFWRQGGELLTAQHLAFYIERARDIVGLSSRVRFHTLRHTFASMLIREGAHPKEVQVLMGHASITVTMDLYGHLFPGMGRERIKAVTVRRQEALRKRLHAV